MEKSKSDEGTALDSRGDLMYPFSSFIVQVSACLMVKNCLRNKILLYSFEGSVTIAREMTGTLVYLR